MVQGLVALLLFVGVIVGTVALIAPGLFPPSSMVIVWEAPDESEATEGEGVWLVGDSVVRSRFDGVTAYDVRSGKKRWEYLVPARSETCASSADVPAGVALIGYRQARPTKETGCGTVAAVDLTNGRELWHTAGVSAEFLDEVDTTGGGLGVVLTGDGRLRAVDLKSGAARWTAPLRKGCVLQDLGLAPKQVVAALMCGDEAMLAAFDPAKGTARWTEPIDARRGVDARASLSVLSAVPATVRVDKPDGAGVSDILAFGPDGRPQARIEGFGDYGQISSTVVEGGRLFALAGGRGADEFLGAVAFDLATGDEMWRTEVFADVLGVRDGRVTTVRPSYKNGDYMYVLDAATGEEMDERGFLEQVRSAGPVLTYQDLVIVVRGGQERPFTVYERWWGSS